MDENEPGQEAGRLLVLITGTGRSGTSTMSGMLHHLGLSVPGPYLGANDSNPKGFFESKWAMTFHRQIHKRARVNDFDGRLDALDRVRDATTDEDVAELDAWFAGSDDEQLVVKDPRTVWHQRLWAERASVAGRSIRYVSMLRHPAEVIGSRATYYAHRVDDLSARGYEICNISRWVTSSLISERETRDQQRAFVGYAELLDDWRPVAERLRSELGLRYEVELDREPHPVDDFVDPDLRRVRVSWDQLDVPDELSELAEQVWQNLCVLAGAGGRDGDASQALEDLRHRHERLLESASAMSYDAINSAAGEARAAGAKEGRRKLRQRLRAERGEG